MLLKRHMQDLAPSMDLTPVIDIVFLLLIFFLVATTFAQQEREMKVTLPEAASAGPISAALRELVINVDASGQIIVSGSPMSEDDLRTMLDEAIKANPKQKVTLRGDETINYGRIIQVLDICKGAGVIEIFQDTVPIG